MTEQQTPETEFARRLRAELREIVTKRAEAASPHPTASAGSPGPGRRSRPLRLALAGAAALAVAVVVLILASGGQGTPRAFAVEPLEGGGVAIKIYSLEDPTALEAALKRQGIPAQVDWLAAGMRCRERHLTRSRVNTAMGGRFGWLELAGPLPAMTIGVMSAAQYRALQHAYVRGDISKASLREELPNFNLDPDSFRPGQTVIISGSPEPHGGDPEGGYRARVEVVEGPVPPCMPVPEAAGTIGAIAVPRDGEAGAGRSAVAAGAAVPGPGQYLFTRTMVVQLEGWEPEGPGTGPRAHPRHFTTRFSGQKVLPALVPTTKEVWTAPDGRTRVRETLGPIRFLSLIDQRRWEEAGSPPPFEYDPSEHHVRQGADGNPMKEYSARNWRGRHAFALVHKLYRLPTEPEPLRLAIEHRPPGSPPASSSSEEGRTTVQRLLEILAEPASSPALQAAAFGALAEIPGIGREPDATDALGRHGEAVRWINERGFGRKVIFDPHTSRVLAEAEMIFGPPSTREYGVPPGTVSRETAFLDSAIVDSIGSAPPAG